MYLNTANSLHEQSYMYLALSLLHGLQSERGHGEAVRMVEGEGEGVEVPPRCGDDEMEVGRGASVLTSDVVDVVDVVAAAVAGPRGVGHLGWMNPDPTEEAVDHQILNYIQRGKFIYHTAKIFARHGLYVIINMGQKVCGIKISPMRARDEKR